VHADARLEDEAAAVGEEQLVEPLEFLGHVLLPTHERAVLHRPVHFHRRDGGARRLAGDRLERQTGEARKFDGAP
jgi:hypothetical protein